MSAALSPVPLNATTLHRLPAHVRVPKYDRSTLRAGIVHIGVGGFHRAHQAVYLDDLLHEPGSEDFGIVGVGLLPQDQHMADVLGRQDGLYTVVTRSATGDEARVIGSIIHYLHAPADRRAVIERMADPATRIVSLTVTEAGYGENKSTGQLDLSKPAIAHDLAHPDEPIGMHGYLAAALRLCRDRGQQPFTVMSCDNLLNNGAVCRRTMLAFLQHLDPSLADWVEREVAFPNSMVDRITPATTDEHRTLVRDRFGIDDGWPVVTEPFRQWVIEDHFPLGRPAWERVGAQFVESVEPYEKMKIRLLNGSHQVMCYIGMLLGHCYSPQAMGDADVAALIERFMEDEVTPLLQPVPGIDLADYKRTLRERFANPGINDQLSRIGSDGSARVAEFVLPTVREQLARGGPIAIGAFTTAAWMRHAAHDPSYVDSRGGRIRELALQGGPDPTPLLTLHNVFGNLAADRRFVDAVTVSLRSLYTDGPRAALRAVLARQ